MDVRSFFITHASLLNAFVTLKVIRDVLELATFSVLAVLRCVMCEIEPELLSARREFMDHLAGGPSTSAKLGLECRR
ncbi:MAG: hypothetical protein ABJA60_12650 [Nitrosospira sp.]